MVLTPWVLEKADPHNFAYIPSKCPMRGDDGDAEVLRDDLVADLETTILLL